MLRLPSPTVPAAAPRLLAGVLLAAIARQALALMQARRRGRQIALAAIPLEAEPDEPRARVLVLGDSTGLGVGAAHPELTLPGLIAQDHPGARIVNRCRNGARVADLPRQLADAGPPPPGGWDLVLVCAGGNDVLRRTPPLALARSALRLLQALEGCSRRVVWLGCPNLGRVPAFHGPLAWWAARRSAEAVGLLRRIAQRRGATFVDFHRPRRMDPFARDAGRWFAPDGVHPSAAAYRHCYDVLAARVPLAAWLGGASSSTVPCQEASP